VSAAGPGRAAVRPVGVVSFAQTKSVRREDHRNEVEMLMPVVTEVFANIGVTKSDMGFVCSGSTDYLVGAPFSFVMALDAVGVWPPMRESHVEMDGAWALYEAWTLMQEGEVDAASLVTAKVGIDGVAGAFADLANPEQHTKIIVEPWR